MHTRETCLSCANGPLVPTVVFECDGPRGSEVHTASADTPKQVGPMSNWGSGLQHGGWREPKCSLPRRSEGLRGCESEAPAPWPGRWVVRGSVVTEARLGHELQRVTVNGGCWWCWG
jgi:hypothetical protein